MSAAIDVARHLTTIGYDENCPAKSVTLSPLRLQKLLYYSQGWSLALLGRPLFVDGIEAWQYGPVVPAVYERFAGRREGLTPADFAPPAAAPDLGAARLMAAVWSEYAKYTPGQLVTMTHAEKPWLAARAGGDRSPITVESMRAFFEGEMRRMTPKGWPSPAEVWRADEQADRGEAVDAKAFFTQLLAEC